MRRDPCQYANCSPDAISQGSQAQMKFFVDDAKHDIAWLLAENARLRKALARAQSEDAGRKKGE